MAQGCHLIFSDADKAHFDYHNRPEREYTRVRDAVLKSIGIPPNRFERNIVSGGEKGAVVINRDQAIAHGIEEGRFRTFQSRFENMSPNDRAVVGKLLVGKPDKQVDFIQGLGNSYLDGSMARTLPDALDRIYRHDSKAIGLFEPARAYASAWVDNLKTRNSGSANGVAYEVLSTAALIDREATNRDGKTLKIHNTDRLTFGLKQQASYGGRGPINVTDGQEVALFHQPDRGTVEADLLITRPTGFLQRDRQIGIDFKHTSVGKSSHVDKSQLEGVFVALQTGDIDEFHFVSNWKFEGAAIRAVKGINQQIKEYNNDPDKISPIPEIQLFEEYKWST